MRLRLLGTFFVNDAAWFAYLATWCIDKYNVEVFKEQWTRPTGHNQGMKACVMAQPHFMVRNARGFLPISEKCDGQRARGCVHNFSFSSEDVWDVECSWFIFHFYFIIILNQNYSNSIHNNPIITNCVFYLSFIIRKSVQVKFYGAVKFGNLHPFILVWLMNSIEILHYIHSHSSYMFYLKQSSLRSLLQPVKSLTALSHRHRHQQKNWQPSQWLNTVINKTTS